MKRKSRVCGEFPRYLYRFFDKEEVAVSFVEKGEFRIKLLQKCKEIECENRRDATEGEGHYKTKGPSPAVVIMPNGDFVERLSDRDMDHHVTHNNPTFLLCCSHSIVNIQKMKERFGVYVVKIHSPVSLAIDIDYALNREDGSGKFLVEGRSVEYSKGLRIEDDREEIELADLAYTQKPEKNPQNPALYFSDEKEFRFCMLYTGIDQHKRDELSSKDFLEINLGERPRYAELLLP